MAKILIKNGRIWDGSRFFYADVLTDAEKVARIEPHITEKADYVYDATGKTVSVGLVDMHVHMRVTPTDEYGIQAEMSCFPFGVTAAADARRIQGERIVMDSFMLKNLVFVLADIRKNRVDFDEVERAIDRFGDKTVGIKVYFDTVLNGVSDLSSLREVCDFAKKRGLRVMVHCSNSPVPMAEVLSVLNEGDILTHAFHGGENHAAQDGFESMREAQARGVIIDTGFAGYVHTDFAVLRQAMENGIRPNTISTDITKRSAYVRGGRYGMTMCMSMARQVGMSEEMIFKAVTSAPAAALGKSGEWGCLRVGGAADLAVLADVDEVFSLTDTAGNCLEGEKSYRCVLTISDGQIVYRD